MTEAQRWLWISDIAMETGSLVFLWEGTMGVQPVLMPGYTFYWWLDDATTAALQQGDEGGNGGSSDVRWRH